MPEYPPDRISGPRLLLRPPALDDAGVLFQRVARDPQVTKYLLWAPHPDVAATRRVITEKLNAGADEKTWVIESRHRGEVIGRAGGNGGMAVAGLSLAQTHELLDRLRPAAVWVAASNAPSSTVLSGDAAELDQIVAALDEDGVFCRRLESVTFASHSPAMQPLSAELAGLLDGLVAHAGTIPMRSTATGEPVVPNGTLGDRYGDSGAGKWNLDLGGTDPLLSADGGTEPPVAVFLPRFDAPGEGAGRIK